MKKLFIIATTLIVLVGCSFNNNETATYKYEGEGYYSEITFTYIEDKVIQEKEMIQFEYDYLGTSDQEQLEQMFTTLKDSYSDIEGVTYTQEFTDSEVILVIDINLEKANTELLQGIYFLPENYNPEADYVSYKERSEMLLNSQYTLKE